MPVDPRKTYESCPDCGTLHRAWKNETEAECTTCGYEWNPQTGEPLPTTGAK